MPSFAAVVRYWIPGFIFALCVVMLIIRPDAVGLEAVALLFGGGAAIVLTNYIQRVGFAGDVERDKESESRAFYQRYGMWPGQASAQLVEEARADGMLQHVVIPPRPAPRASRGPGGPGGSGRPGA